MPIRIVTIALFVISGVVAAIAIYQQFTVAKPYAVSRERAIAIALAEIDMLPDRDPTVLPQESAKAALIHIYKDGWAFLVDENSLGDTWAFGKSELFEGHEEEYVWYVEVTTSNINGGSRGYCYLIDIDNGTTIGNGMDISKTP